MKSPHAPRILISLPASLGHCLSLLDLLFQLRRDCPDAEVWGLSRADQFASEEPRSDFDGWIELACTRPACWHAWRHPELRHRRFDIFLDATPERWGAWPGWFSAAPVRVGFARRPRSLRDLLYHHTVAPRCDSTSQRQLELLAPLALPEHDNILPFRSRAPSRATARRILTDAHLACPYVALHVGDPESAAWRCEDFGKLARELGERFQLPSLLLWHGPSGRPGAQRAAAKSGGHGFVSPPASLSVMAEFIAQSVGVVSIDQELLSAAAALGKPVTNPLKSSSGGKQPSDWMSVELVAEACLRASRGDDMSRQREKNRRIGRAA